MTGRVFAGAEKGNPTWFPSIAVDKPGQAVSPKFAANGHQISSSRPGHNFGDIRVTGGTSFNKPCPLSPSGPSHCPYGGACHACPARIQTKLTVGQPGDRYEREADRAAEQIMRMPLLGIESDSENSTASGYISKSHVPKKALGVSPGRKSERKPSPTQGDATIQCDGSGSYEIVYNGWAGAACGTKTCVTAHEASHIADWRAKWPIGCQGQPKGYLPKGDPPDNPLMTEAEYDKFLKESECKAHTVDIQCAKGLPQPAACKETVKDYINLTEAQRKEWCPSLSGWEKALIGAGAGALAGAGIGALAGGPLGAAIGAGIGALVGGVTGSLL